RHFTGALRECAARDVDDHGQLGFRVRLRSPDVEVEAVFADAVLDEVFAGPRKEIAVDVLHAARAEFTGIANAGPGLHRLWLAPAEIADRRCRERNALENRDMRSWIDCTGEGARTDLGHGNGLAKEANG